MREISPEQRYLRMRADNPWWEGGRIRQDYADMKPRAYFERCVELVKQRDVRRALVLMGPRRVGKTVLLHHIIAHLLESREYTGQDIGYVSLDQPLYTRLSIEETAQEICRANRSHHLPRALFLDEIQYLADWERHLKTFVDAHPDIRCVVSGSAAAALRLKSVESGAGRFTDFLLPPLTFYEYLNLQGINNLVEHETDNEYKSEKIKVLNSHFIDYVNFGGYPEALSSDAIRLNPGRYIGSDIIEKVLLRDLPSLYGIQDVQELNALFTVLAYNTAEEVSLEGLSQNSGVSKPTLRRYLRYLEAAFLIKLVYRIDRNARRFQRANRFKIYLTTPALRCAFFGPIAADDKEMGAIAETAVFAQWFHSGINLHYARWRQGRQQGEVDIVCLNARQKPDWHVDVKWSDHYVDHPEKLKSLAAFSRLHPQANALVTTRTKERFTTPKPGMGRLDFVPTSLYCYAVGHRAIHEPSPGAGMIATIRHDVTVPGISKY